MSVLFGLCCLTVVILYGQIKSTLTLERDAVYCVKYLKLGKLRVTNVPYVCISTVCVKPIADHREYGGKVQERRIINCTSYNIFISSDNVCKMIYANIHGRQS